MTAHPDPPADYPAEYDGPVYVGPEQDEPELVDADVDEGPVPAAGEREEEWEPILCPTCHSPGPCYFLDSGNAMPYYHAAKRELIEASAVPVVHPEPGDRAEEDDGFDTRLVPQEAWDAAQAAVQARWPDMRPVDAALLSTYAVRTAAPLIVAAAVAAVRADPGVQPERAEKEMTYRQWGDSWYEDEERANADQAPVHFHDVGHGDFCDEADQRLFTQLHASVTCPKCRHRLRLPAVMPEADDTGGLV